nr:caspase family protein [Amylibacter sp.]
MLRLWTLVLTALLAATPVAAKRVALVIGNNDYENLTPLTVAVSDAQSHCSHLKNIRKFEHVDCLYNATKRQIDTGIITFLQNLDQGDTAMFVYAGHGVQLDPNVPETMFLIPTDLQKTGIEAGTEEWSLRQFAVQFDEVRAAVRKRGVRLSVFVLDNCRDNPLAGSSSRSLAMMSGLGRLPADRGEFIFFSASEGETALDRITDKDKNSPFTSAFLEEFLPNVPLVTVANRVEQSVLRLTRNAGLPPQRPRYDDNVEGEGCLEGVGACSPDRDDAEVNRQVNAALVSQEYQGLVSLISKIPNHPRQPEVIAAIETHHKIDLQHTELDLVVLKRMFATLVRHPRREEVRELIRRAILLETCVDLQRYGWTCPVADVADVVPETIANVDEATVRPTATAPQKTPFETLSSTIDLASLEGFNLPLARLQEALIALDFYQGRADGKTGPQTRAGIADWRRSVGSKAVDRDLLAVEQLLLIQQAAEKSPSSRALLGLFKAQGIGFDKNLAEGRALLKQAINDGFKDGQAWLDSLNKL